MSLISWEEYLSIFIDNLREAYKREFSKYENLERLDQLPKNVFTMMTFPQPCQVEVVEFPLIPQVIWVITSESDKQDKSFKIFQATTGPREFFRTYHHRFEFILWTLRVANKMAKDGTKKLYLLSIQKNFLALVFLTDLRKNITPQDLCLRIFNDWHVEVTRQGHRFGIERSISTILDEAKEITETAANPTIIKATKSIQDAFEKLKMIDEHEEKLLSMESDLIGVRKLIGTETFGEWRTLVSDIDKLKGEHVPKGEFEKEIDRLDERIDALNTRIDDLREVRFTRARTILEIVLGIIAATSTIVATLLAAGIIKL